jgi:hypothetical protein
MNTEVFRIINARGRMTEKEDEKLG